MLFLYSDAGSHFKHNKIPHKITYGLVSIQGWPLIQVKITKKDKHRTATGWPRRLFDDSRCTVKTRLRTVSAANFISL